MASEVNKCIGLWYLFDYRCNGSRDCIRVAACPGVPSPPPRVPEVEAEWLGHMELPDGHLNSAVAIKGNFVSLSLVAYDVAPPDIRAPSGFKFQAARGRLPQWNGLRCPYCDKPNTNYDSSRGDQKRHISVSYSVRDGPRPEQSILRLDSIDAPEFWLEFELPTWIVSK